LGAPAGRVSGLDVAGAGSVLLIRGLSSATRVVGLPQQREAVVEVRLQYEEVDIPIPRPGQVEWTREDAVEQIRRIDRGLLEERGGLRRPDEVAEAVHHSGGVAGFEELVEDPREISRHDVRGHERMRQLREGDLRG